MIRIALAALALAVIGACAAPAADTDVLYAYRVEDPVNGDAVLTEIERTAHTSTLEVDIPRSYGALGGGLTMIALLTDLAHTRGFTHFVELTPREWPEAPPAKGGLMFVGFCNGAEPADLAVFGNRFRTPEGSAVVPVDVPEDRLVEISKFRSTR